MARRLATVGYYVMLPNLYYRAGKDTKYGPDVLEKGSAEQARMRAVRTKMTIPPVMDDVAAMIAFADSQKESKKGPVGTHGYCMSGPYSLAAAARYPDRIAAAASFYGTWLVSDAVESPHLTLGKAKGELYISCAEHDELAPPDMVEGAEGAVRQVGQRRRARDPDGRPSRLRLPRTLVLRQAGRRAPLGAPDRAVPPPARLALPRLSRLPATATHRGSGPLQPGRRFVPILPLCPHPPVPAQKIHRRGARPPSVAMNGLAQQFSCWAEYLARLGSPILGNGRDESRAFARDFRVPLPR